MKETEFDNLYSRLLENTKTDWSRQVRYVLDDGTVEYILYGDLHRTDGPARVRPSGIKEWCIHGMYHRTDGPAIEYPDGTEQWYQNDKLHRIGGPAVITPKHKAWFVNGKRHRLDGPAIEYASGAKEWFIDNQKLTRDQFRPLSKIHKKTEALPHQDILDLESVNSKPVLRVSSVGTKRWWLDGKMHRVGAPALIYKDGGEEWYYKGKLHRAGGPAIEWADGTKYWIVNGMIHRLDGPAKIDSRGKLSWFINNEKIPVNSQEEFERWLELDKSVLKLPRQDILDLE